MEYPQDIHRLYTRDEYDKKARKEARKPKPSLHPYYYYGKT